MVFWVYVSSAVGWFSMAELRLLLAKCRERNERDGITGMLLFKDGHFMQVVEGQAEAVKRLHDRIHADPRHRDIVTVDSGPIEARRFADWSMAFYDLNEEGAALPAGYSEFLDTPLDDPTFIRNPDRSRQLLMLFKQFQ
jgi:hypothetical protein